MIPYICFANNEETGQKTYVCWRRPILVFFLPLNGIFCASVYTITRTKELQLFLIEMDPK